MKKSRASKYDIVVHMQNDDVHTRQIRWVGPDRRVLECGCDTGYVSKVLTEDFGCEVTGIESNPVAAEVARTHCADVVVADLDELDFAGALGDRRFDVVLFGDVLEHLKNPWAVLERARAVLAPEGRVIACVPNVAERNVILNLMLGQFEYQKLGLLDRTHLRFFTAASLRRMFEAAGYVIARIDRVENEEVEREVAVDLEAFPPAVLDFLARSNPDSRTIQFLVEAHPATEAGTIAALRGELVRREADEHEQEDTLRQLRVDLADAQDELARARDDAARLAAEVAELRERIPVLERTYAARLEAQVAEQVTTQVAAAVHASQETWSRALRDSEARWRERIAEHATHHAEELRAVAHREETWRTRALAAEEYAHRLAHHPAVRMIRALGRRLRGPR